METWASFMSRCEAIAGMKYSRIPRGEANDAVLPIAARRGNTYLVESQVGYLVVTVPQS